MAETNELFVAELQKALNKFVYALPSDTMELSVSVEKMQIGGELRAIIKSVKW